MKEHEESYYAFKPIKENPLILDFTGCRYIGEIHRILKRKFGLPEYYGENWSALWDCLSYLFCHKGEWLVEIHGFRALPEELREGCAPILEIFERTHEETPNVSFRIVS